MARRRSSTTICDSFLCTAAVATPLVLSLAYYRNDLRQLLRLLFLGVVLFGALLTLRHSLRRALLRLNAWLSRGKKEEEEVPQPGLDRGKEQARRRAQMTHNEKAEDYDRRIAGPRRERRLEEEEKKMRHVRGFGDEGQALGGEGGDRQSSRLLQRHVEQSRARSHDGHVMQSGQSSGEGGRVEQGTQSDQSDDGAGSGHVTEGREQEDDHVTEGDQSGKLIRIALKLPNRTVQKQFYTTQTIKVLYRWLSSEGYPEQLYSLSTLLPRCLLEDRGKTLEQCGITTDTRLVVEEREE